MDPIHRSIAKEGQGKFNMYSHTKVSTIVPLYISYLKETSFANMHVWKWAVVSAFALPERFIEIRVEQWQWILRLVLPAAIVFPFAPQGSSDIFREAQITM